ncbi:MAG: vitamin B12-dependent ribonucleotide reductase [Gemmatimonadetes bacterium]|nr:vitamin B12-dependent ribonucleotide reductase [Gemmatimonadota bacterium]
MQTGKPAALQPRGGNEVSGGRKKLSEEATGAAVLQSRAQSPDRASVKGLSFERVYTTEGVHPYDEVEWEKRDASIQGEEGRTVFERKDLEFPTFWSQLATNVTVSKYFHKVKPDGNGERSLRQLIDRVANTITQWGDEDGYFATDEDREVFRHELIYLLLHQNACFNSPVWFNVGIEEKPQCSACFINAVEDRMESILELAKTEGMLFKWGSGTGSNLSTIRSSREFLSSGGTCSGPVSFMKGYDAFAGVIKSGGKTRRAAKMVILNAEHPDVVDFIDCKAAEEKKAWILIDKGYDGSLDGEAYQSIFFQNSNNSVRANDKFMQAVVDDGDWNTRAVADGQIVDTYSARDIMYRIADATHVCGDPGMQFDTAINDWHTCPNTDRIHASNPCSEYMFLDDTACNLASINLMRYRQDDGSFDTARFAHTVDVILTAQEIFVDRASYPTPAIDKNSHDFRPLGLGYANLGALLMSNGLPYDGDDGRAYAAAVTSLLCGRAYRQSAKMAAVRDPFNGYEKNRKPMLRVIGKHRAAAYEIDADTLPSKLWTEATRAWDEALELGRENGYRNSQVTVLAPTGTIGFMMDCDTTGVEPDIALVKYKKLVGGGVMKIVNQTVPQALKVLGYDSAQIVNILDYIDANDTIEGAPGLKDADLAVFDCAFKPNTGVRSIHHMGHIRMMGAVQPFLSGAISKTVNMPTEATPEEIMDAYIQAWKLGVKAVAIYRDGSKRTQPLTTMDEGESGKARDEKGAKAQRRRLPDERHSITHKFSVGGHEGYITVGLYEDGLPGEIFITMSKEGSVVSGLMDGFATSISMALQYGVPLTVLCNKFSHMRFEPSGFTNNKEIPIAKSVTDYIFRWLDLKFMQQDAAEESMDEEGVPLDRNDLFAGALTIKDLPEAEPDVDNRIKGAFEGTRAELRVEEKRIFQSQSDAPPCYNCGEIMVRNGACYKCLNCGSVHGCS